MSDPTPLGQRAAAGGFKHPLTQALLALTFSTGLVDAASYLGLGHVFSGHSLSRSRARPGKHERPAKAGLSGEG